MPLLALLFLFWQTDPVALGMKALEDQKFDQAVTHFAAALKADPEDLGANFHSRTANADTNSRSRSADNYATSK